MLTMNLPQSKVESCTLHDVLLVPDLAYNLLSITSTSKKGKTTTFTEVGCELKSKLIASGYREGSLYYLGPVHQACSSSHQNSSTLGIAVLATWELKESKSWQRTKRSVDSTLIGGKSQVSATPISRERVTGYPSNIPPGKGQTIHLISYTVICVGRLEHGCFAEVNTSSRLLMTTPDLCGSIF